VLGHSDKGVPDRWFESSTGAKLFSNWLTALAIGEWW
jgi:hypothetical protein